MRRRQQLGHVHHRASNCWSWRRWHPFGSIHHHFGGSLAREKSKLLSFDLGYVWPCIMLGTSGRRCLHRTSDVEMVLLSEFASRSADCCRCNLLSGELSAFDIRAELVIAEETAGLGSARQHIVHQRRDLSLARITVCWHHMGLG